MTEDLISYTVMEEDGGTHTHVPDITPIMIDAMSREIEAGDILNWRSGGYFGHYMAFGMVTQVDYGDARGCIKVINHNGNRVTLWNTHKCVILAKANDYSNIPREYLKIWINDD